MKIAFAVVALTLSLHPWSAGAKPVYKCEEKGAITYTDRPCTPDAAALELPAPIVTAPPTQAEKDLARAHQERLARERAERDRAVAEWLRQHEQGQEQQQAGPRAAPRDKKRRK